MSHHFTTGDANALMAKHGVDAPDSLSGGKGIADYRLTRIRNALLEAYEQGAREGRKQGRQVAIYEFGPTSRAIAPWRD